MELRKLSCPFEVKMAEMDEGEKVGRIEGYGSVFGVVDSYGEIVDRGAFTRSLSGGMPSMLWQHNMDDPIGVWKYAAEDEYGLKLFGEINLEVQKGKEAYALAKQGALRGLSIGFMREEAEKDDSGVTHLKAVRLLEVSMVTFPANDKSLIEAVRSVGIKTEREFEKFLRDAGFSRKEATAITLHGFKSVNDIERDAPMGELVSLLKQTINILETTNGNDGNQKPC